MRSKNGNVVSYFLTDHLGSTVALADANGAIVFSTSYDSFGNAATSIPTSYQYTGREYDSDTGLYYYRNRWYDPEIGRFISEDPIGFAGGDINLYGYVGNNPQNFVDPLGNYACKSGRFAQNGKAPFSKKKQKKADKQIKKLKKKLNKPGRKCQKNVIDKLKTIAGFSVGAFKEFLNKGVNIYDGTKSTIALTSATHSSQIKGKAPEGYTVAKLFAENTGLNALTSGNLSVNGLTVFWNPKADFSPSRIFHEALHGFGASLNDGSLGDFGDKELLELFNVKGVAGKNTGGITEYIDKYCF